MLSKIDFENGQIVRRDFLKEVQKGTNFSQAAREVYYGEPTEAEHNSWSIGSRDKIKDWEVADPGSEPQSVLGRMAYDGIVLGYNTDTEEVVFGPPALISVGEGYAVRVERGSAILSNGTKVSWDRQLVQLLSGSQVNYIYLSEPLALQSVSNGSNVLLSVRSSLPSVTFPHVPLAKITLNANSNGLLLGSESDPDSVVGNGYVDLRPSTYIGNLNTYPRNLTNTEIITDSVQIGTWKRAIVDTSNGSLVVTLPSSPEDSDRVAIADISGTFDRYPVIIRLPEDGESCKINGSIDDWIVNVRDGHLELYFNAETNQWKFEESPGGECNPVLGTFLSCGGKEYIGEKLPEQCPDGQPIPAIYPNPSEGTYEYELGTSKCYKSYNSGVAIYSNGQGGLITVLGANRCNRSGKPTNENATSGGGILAGDVRNIIYVDPTIGDDSLKNNGFSPDRPFRTPERAIIEATRESRRVGAYNDRYDRIVIELAPGDYYVDNSPGSGSTSTLTFDSGLVQLTPTSFNVATSVQGNKVTIIEIQTNDTANYPPNPILLGRVLYSSSGGVGNITKLEKIAPNSTVWKVTLEYVRGSFNLGDQLLYDNLSIINPVKGGIVVPRGISINGVDLRKVRIRPMYVPPLNPIQDGAQERTSIWKVTGGSYVSLQTFTDNLQYARSHNTVTSVTFASKSDLAGDSTTVSYYAKLNALFSIIDGWGSDGLEYLGSESAIVAPVPSSYNFRQQDNEENQTGYPGGDSRPSAPISFPGPTRVSYTSDSTSTPLNLPDVNSTRSSSPYVFNCSVRSIFGLNGLHADGASVDGLKSMVTANFTQVSLQTDPNCYDDGTYYGDPPANSLEGGAKRFKESSSDPFKYRNIGFRGSNDAVIQIVSCFVIGNSDHFVSDSGGDLSITNSCSDFGDISLKAIGYKNSAFSQDEGPSAEGYNGTRILEVIPPLPLTYNSNRPTLEDADISTGFTIDTTATVSYLNANKEEDDSAPEFYRVYINNDPDAPYTLSNPPSAESMGFGQYAFTKLDSSNEYVLVGGETHPERRRIYIVGFDKNANSVIYTANLNVANSNNNGFSALDYKSKVFSWDGGRGQWYFTVDTGGIVETNNPDSSGYLVKKLDSAFFYKLLSNPTTAQSNLVSTDFVFDGSAIKIIRGVDTRSNDERVYQVVLDGFKKSNGIRKPQPYYIMEKQAGVAGGALNRGSTLGTNPLTVTSIRNLSELEGIPPTSVNYPEYEGKYVTYLSLGEDARKVFQGNLYPQQDFDEPEATEDPLDSLTRVALVAMLNRPGVWFSNPIEPKFNRIQVKTSSSSDVDGIKIGLRRPSIIRASGHTWEWTGYLNYDTALPAFQNNPLEERFALEKIIDESKGGRVYATGMNEEGNYYIGTTVFDLRSGEQFAIPYKNNLTDTVVSNQVFSSVVVRNSLLLKDKASVIFGKDTNLFFNNTTKFKSLTTGDITANNAILPDVYANEERAGIVQLAKLSDIRGAFGAAEGISKRVVVTARQLARELTSRFNSNAIQESTGIKVTVTTVDPPDGDPESNVDDVYTFSIGVDEEYGGFTPVGGIIMWSGTIAAINSLTNWKLCDGTFGTPDLRNRFIIGASSDNLGQSATTVTGPKTKTGGTKDAILPSHDHTAGVSPSGSHTHTVQISLDTEEFQANGGTGGFITDDGSTTGDGTLEIASENQGSQIGGAHLGDTDVNGQHTHAVTIVAEGEDPTNKNLPPYYALAYIMRIA